MIKVKPFDFDLIFYLFFGRYLSGQFLKSQIFKRPINFQSFLAYLKNPNILRDKLKACVLNGLKMISVLENWMAGIEEKGIKIKSL